MTESLNNAAKYFNQGEWEKADFACRRILQSDPKNVDALHILALICTKRGKTQDAIDLIKQAYELRPEDPELLTNLANLLKANGDYIGAREHYELALAADSKCLAAISNLALLQYEKGDYAASINTYKRALTIDNNLAQIHFSLSIVQKAATDRQAALASCLESIKIEPNTAATHVHLGNLFYEEKAPDKALAAYQRAAAIDPNNAIALNGIGITQTELGNYHAAKEALEKSLKFCTNIPDLYNNMAVVYFMLGHNDEAINCYKSALQLNPNFAEAWRNYGNVLADKKKFLDAVTCHQKAVVLEPTFYEAQLDLSIALKECGEVTAAKKSFEQAAQLNPHATAPLCGFVGACLPNFYWTENEIVKYRQDYNQFFSELENHLATGKFDSLEAEDGLGLLQPYYLTYQGQNDLSLNTKFGALLLDVLKKRYPQWSENKLVVSSRQKIRLGIVSHNFNNHADWKMIINGIVSHFNRDIFELFGYSTGGVHDEITKFASIKMHRFHSGLNFINLCQQIKHDTPDILLFPGLGMDHVSMKIACLRLAPIQCCAWGRPDTSGLANIDYFISPQIMEPENAQAFYKEELITLPGVGFYYEPASPRKNQNLHIEGLRSTSTKLLCVQSLYKYLPQYDFIYAQLAKDIPDSQFIFVARPDGLASKFIDRLKIHFVNEGLNPSHHIVMLPWLDQGQFASLCEQSDIFLDSIGFSGCVTVLDALEQSLPIVTMAGTFMRGRQATGILNLLDLHELVTKDTNEYIAKVRHLANDLVYRQSIKEKIAQNRYKLYRDSTVIKSLEDKFRTLVMAASANQVFVQPVHHQVYLP